MQINLFFYSQMISNEAISARYEHNASSRTKKRYQEEYNFTKCINMTSKSFKIIYKE